MADPRRRAPGVLATLALVAATILSPGGWVAAAAEGHGDQVDPPAPGEAQPLDDPSEPDVPPAAAHPDTRFAAASAGWLRPAVEGLSGKDRYATAIAVSRTGWPGTAPAVVLATGEDYPDALAAATLAGTAGGPLLLTPTATLHLATADELGRLQPRTVFVVGQVSDAVEAAVGNLGLQTERIRGEGRYDTAFDIAQRAAELGADTSTVLVASGEGFADPLAATPIAAAFRYPILLSPRNNGQARLADQVAALGARRTLGAVTE